MSMAPGAEIPACLLALLHDAYGPEAAADRLTLLNRGNYGNANVYRLDLGETRLLVKEFYSRPWIVRATFGRLLVAREARALAALAGIAGVPGQARRLGSAALAEKFVDGETLVDLHRKRRAKLPPAFFRDFERLVDEMHRAGYAHLDLRNPGNVICGPDGRPYVLDFQSCMRTARLPRGVRRLMEDADRSGIYKFWAKMGAEPLDPERAAFLERFKGLRRFWIFKGYWFGKTWKQLTRRRK